MTIAHRYSREAIWGLKEDIFLDEGILLLAITFYLNATNKTHCMQCITMLIDPCWYLLCITKHTSSIGLDRSSYKKPNNMAMMLIWAVSSIHHQLNWNLNAYEQRGRKWQAKVDLSIQRRRWVSHEGTSLPNGVSGYLVKRLAKTNNYDNVDVKWHQKMMHLLQCWTISGVSWTRIEPLMNVCVVQLWCGVLKD